MTEQATISRGRESEFDQMEVGRLELQVDNSDRRFSPGYASSVIGASNLVPRRPIRIRMTSGSVSGALFYGYIKRIKPQPKIGNRTMATIEAEDALSQFQRANATVSLQQGVTTGCALGLGLDAIGFPSASRSIDTGGDSLAYFWVRDQNAKQLFDDLARSEGGIYFINASGGFTFKSRSYNYTNQTSSASFSNVFDEFDYDLSDEKIYNDVRLTAHPRTTASNTTIWSLGDIPVMAGSTSASFWSVYTNPSSLESVPALNVASPVVTTDYTMNSLADSSGSNLTTNAVVSFSDFGETGKAIVTNNGSTQFFVTKLQIRGAPLHAPNPIQKRSDDATSTSAYQQRTLEMDLVWQQDSNQAQSAADWFLGIYKNPVPRVAMGYVAERSNDLLAQSIQRELAERISITETVNGISGQDYFIGRIDHQIELGGRRHLVRYILEKAPDATYWILEVSQIDLNAYLAY